ncbi:MAG: hypothetical protein BGN99_20965 [Alphaproteobacteria bacterium 65-37]|jgi:polysaccharide pyruvyl transferase WcaK-like protein|nr:polysaccharide pyruvyl transferase family protein [Alphaproteobacteria bacterium]OJU47194.1 MAG: hypothetical protein BGN99_20965 [Alphaproteobacteria bacterium 65-37]
MKRPRIGLIGYYGYGNYGDELFHVVFRKIFHDCDLVTMQDNQTRPYYNKDLKEKIASMDCLLIGGGDLVIGSYWTDQYFEDPFLAKPIYIHGVGVPTWSREDPKIVERLAKFFRHKSVRHINVRDQESRAWIEEKLAPSVPVTVTSDMVCALDIPNPPKRQGPPVFGLITRKQMPGEIHWKNVTALCDKARSLGYEVKNIILGTGGDRTDDLVGLAEFPYPHMRTVQSENLVELTREIGSCDVIASMKFHGCVVSTLYGIPAITTITTDKFRNFFQAIERPELIAHHTHTNLADRLAPFMARIPRLTRDHLRRSAIGGLAELRRAMLDEFA